MPSLPAERTVGVTVIVDVTRSQRVWAVLVSAAIASVIVATSIARVLAEYKSTATFYVQTQGRSLPSGLADLAASTGLLASQGQTQSPYFFASLAVSQEVLLEVGSTSRSGNLDTSLWNALLDNPPSSWTDSADAIKILRGMIQTSIDHRSGTVSVNVLTRDPYVSRDIASAVFDAISATHIRQRRQAARERREFLADRIAEATKTRDSIGNELVTFLAKNRDVSASPDLVYRREILQREHAFATSFAADLRTQEVSAGLAELDDQGSLVLIDAPRANPRKARPRVLFVLLPVAPFVLLLLALASGLLSARVSSRTSTGHLVSLEIVTK